MSNFAPVTLNLFVSSKEVLCQLRMTFLETAISFRLLSFFILWQDVPIAVQRFADGLFAWQSQLNGVIRAKGSHKVSTCLLS